MRRPPRGPSLANTTTRQPGCRGGAHATYPLERAPLCLCGLGEPQQGGQGRALRPSTSLCPLCSGEQGVVAGSGGEQVWAGARGPVQSYGVEKAQRAAGDGLTQRGHLREGGASGRGHLRVRSRPHGGRPCGGRPRRVAQRLCSASRQVYKAKSNETGELVALKRVRMDNEKEGVRATAPRAARVVSAPRIRPAVPTAAGRHGSFRSRPSVRSRS